MINVTCGLTAKKPGSALSQLYFVSEWSVALFTQCVRLERSVAVRLSHHRSVDRVTHPLLHSVPLPRSAVGRQQIHQETARTQRHRQQRTA